MTYFDERLKELHRQRAQKKRLIAMKEDLLKQDDEVAKKVAELSKIKKKEQLDVEQLEGMTFKALFAAIAGNKEEKLSQERQEAYVAAMKYDAAMQDLQRIQADLRYCEEEIEKLVDCETEYQDLLAQKKSALKQEAAHQANEVALLEKDLGTLEHEIIELEEALEAGYKAFDLADRIVTELEEADDLANWDTFMDSILIDMQKHEHIHSAQDLIGSLRNELRRFRTELADVHIEEHIEIEMDDFSQFADWFFDNIFTDWDIKQKIENSLKEAGVTRNQIKNTINTLKDMRDERMKNKAELDEKLENLVVGE